MVHLLDARDGSSAEVRPARPRLLRVCAHLPESAGPADVTWLRICLFADLLFRTAELQNMQVLIVLSPNSESQLEGVKHATDALGLHPPAAHASVAEAHAEPADVHVIGQGDDLDGGWRGLITRVGAAQAKDTQATDPVAIRHALMSFPYHQPADLTENVLADSDAELNRWRRYVADWAELPSRPMPAAVAAAAGTAFDALDTVSALGLLRDLIPDQDVPNGAKFETFVYADRVLGLALPSEIGR